MSAGWPHIILWPKRCFSRDLGPAWRFFRFCDFSSEEVRFSLRTTARHGDYEAVNRPRCAADNRRYSWNRRSYFGSLFRLNLGVQIGQLAALSSDLTQLMMFQGSCRPTRTPEVSRPPIPHRPRGGHAPGTSVSPRLSRIQAPGQARCRNRYVALPGAHIRERYGETEVPGSCTWPCASFSCSLSD